MTSFLLTHEPAIRLGAFAGIFTVMALWEVLAPRRRQGIGRWKRWPANLGIVVLASLLLRLIFPTAAVGVALFAAAHGWGLLHALAVPDWLALIASLLLLDMAIYLQHVMFHALPLLWRLHRVHHADLEIDLTTGARFHPLEILLSLLFKFGVIAALGAPALTACCAGCWSRRTCIACITPGIQTKPTPTSASTCRGGIACSAPIARNPATVTPA